MCELLQVTCFTMQSSLYWLLVLGCVFILIPNIAHNVWAKPTEPEQLAAMADTLKYLQQLDRYYSQIARPRSVVLRFNSAVYLVECPRHTEKKKSQANRFIFLVFQFGYSIRFLIRKDKLTLILRRSRTGTVSFYTSTSNKRAARPKLYTKSLTRDLKLMYIRLTLVRISLIFRHRASCIQGQAFHYSPENAFYIFNQQIYFII